MPTTRPKAIGRDRGKTRLQRTAGQSPQPDYGRVCELIQALRPGSPAAAVRHQWAAATACQFLGSWAVAADQGRGAKQIHTVYASPGTIAAYRKGGRFADGSVLVKEVLMAATGPMTTGTVSHVQTLSGWFVLMKDSKNRHPGNKLWGDGWGWSWFDAANSSKTTSTDYKADCLPCHEPARATDWIYVQGYPALKQ